MTHEICYLADKPDLIPTLALWTFNAWKQYDPTLNMDNITTSLNAKLNKDTLPLTLIALNDSVPIGMVSLKPQIKVKGYEDRKIWLGSFYVAPEHRGQSVGQELLTAAYDNARRLGYDKISLFSSEPEVWPWYLNKGWEKFATDSYQGHTVALMEYKLKM